jgi:hypothetical protein
MSCGTVWNANSCVRIIILFDWLVLSIERKSGEFEVMCVARFVQCASGHVTVKEYQPTPPSRIASVVVPANFDCNRQSGSGIA